MRNPMVFLVLALVLAACSAPSTPAPSPTSTEAPAPSATSEPTLSPTPAPSHTPEPVLSPTPTFLFILPTRTASLSATPSAQLDCDVLSQSVPNGTHFLPKERFDVAWNLTNTGSASWFPGSVEFVFLGGNKTYVTSSVHLQTTVITGDNVALDVDMVAPRNSTKYTTFWGLRQGTNIFCRVSLTFYVP